MKALSHINSNVLSLISEQVAKEIITVPINELERVDHVQLTMHLLESEAKRIKKLEAELASKRKQIDAVIEAMKQTIKDSVVGLPDSTLEGKLIKFNVSQSAPKMIVEDPSLIPNEYFQETVVRELRKDALKSQLALGDTIPGARLEYGLTLKTLTK